VADMKKTGFAGIDLPKQSLTYIGVGVIAILLFVFLGIFPAGKSLADLDARTTDVQYRIEEHKALLPLYQNLKDRTGKEDLKFLPLPAKGTLPHAAISTIATVFGDEARSSGMSLLSASPQISAMSGGAQTLPVNVTLQGNFMNFRKFLVSIGGIPYVLHVEEISIQEAPNAREFKLKILLAVG
jgi:Tfp pilus assembly protein PilO